MNKKNFGLNVKNIGLNNLIKVYKHIYILN